MGLRRQLKNLNGKTWLFILFFLPFRVLIAAGEALFIVVLAGLVSFTQGGTLQSFSPILANATESFADRFQDWQILVGLALVVFSMNALGSVTLTYFEVRYFQELSISGTSRSLSEISKDMNPEVSASHDERLIAGFLNAPRAIYFEAPLAILRIANSTFIVLSVFLALIVAGGLSTLVLLVPPVLVLAIQQLLVGKRIVAQSRELTVSNIRSNSFLRAAVSGFKHFVGLSSFDFLVDNYSKLRSRQGRLSAEIAALQAFIPFSYQFAAILSIGLLVIGQTEDFFPGYDASALSLLALGVLRATLAISPLDSEVAKLRKASVEADFAFEREVGPHVSEFDKTDDAPITLEVNTAVLELNGKKELRVKCEPVIHNGSGLVVFSGDSGVGKTSLLEALAGLRVVKSGKCFVTGKKKVFVPANVPILPIPLEDNILMGNKTNEGKKKLIHLMERVDLDRGVLGNFVEEGADSSNRSPLKLSTGQEARATLLRAVFDSPDVLIVDEPTAHLDKSTSASVVRFLELESRNRIVIVASHSPSLFNAEFANIFYLG